MRRLRGSTNQRRFIFIADTSSTTGAGLANLTHNSSGLVAYYIAGDLNNEVQITLVAGTLGTYVSGGFVAVDNTNMPGWYEIGIPDAALDGGNQVAIQYRGATNMAPVNIYIELDAVDYQDSAAFGLSRLDQTIGSRMASYTQPTGFLAATFPTTVASPTNITSASGVVLAAQTHTGAVIPTVTSVASVSGNIGGISGVTFPANFSLLSISGAGAIGLVDELGPQALSANSLEADIASQVWNTLTTGSFTDESFGDRILISANNTRALAITGSGHIASVLHDAEPNSIPEDAFQSGAISARVIATDAIDADALADGAITSGVFAADSITATALATSAVNEVKDAVAAITQIADLATMIVNDGTANARYSVSALQNGPSGAGGSVINVYPVSASTPERVAGTTITFYRNENRSVSVVTDFTLTALTLRFVVEDLDGNDIEVIEDGSISRSDKTFTVTIGTDVTATLANYRWALRDVTSGSDSVIARGVLSVQEAASNA